MKAWIEINGLNKLGSALLLNLRELLVQLQWGLLIGRNIKFT